MIQTIDYWIIEDLFIFKSEFNDLICDSYIKLISKCNKLIFSNYQYIDHMIANSNTYNEKLDKYYLMSKFNKELPENFSSLDNLTYIDFGSNFNKPLKNLFADMNNLTHLIFGLQFNQELIALPPNLTHLVLDDYFSSKLVLPEKLEFLSLGFYFHHELEIPISVKHIELNTNNQKIIDYLHDTIEKLVLGESFFLDLINLPSSIKYLEIKNNEINLIILPKSIKYLKIPKDFDINKIKNSLNDNLNIEYI